MKKDETLYSLEQLERAAKKLEEAIESASDGDELKQDGAIQRFEFTFELLWKTLKLYLSLLGKVCNNPRDTLKEAFRQQIFTDEPTFSKMLEDRNISTHVYDFKTTRRIFGHIQKKYLGAIQSLINDLKTKIDELS